MVLVGFVCWRVACVRFLEGRGSRFRAGVGLFVGLLFCVFASGLLGESVRGLARRRDLGFAVNLEYALGCFR